MIRKQRKNIRKKGNYGKLSFDDIKRVDKYLNRNIFDNSECCIYKGELKKNYSWILKQRIGRTRSIGRTKGMRRIGRTRSENKRHEENREN